MWICVGSDLNPGHCRAEDWKEYLGFPAPTDRCPQPRQFVLPSLLGHMLARELGRDTLRVAKDLPLASQARWELRPADWVGGCPCFLGRLLVLTWPWRAASPSDGGTGGRQKETPLMVCETSSL